MFNHLSSFFAVNAQYGPVMGRKAGEDSIASRQSSPVRFLSIGSKTSEVHRHQSDSGKIRLKLLPDIIHSGIMVQLIVATNRLCWIVL